MRLAARDLILLIVSLLSLDSEAARNCGDGD